MSDNNELSLFPDFENEWQKEWKGMPEFIAENKEPSQQIIVSFRSFEDVKKFGELIGIKVTPKTKSTWFPERPIDTGEYYFNKDWGKDEE